MFTPLISQDQRRQLCGLQARLADALKPAITKAPAKLKPLVAKRAELTAEVTGIERGASAANLEDSAQQLVNLKAQLHLVELQIKDLQDAHSKAVELARQQRAQALDSISSEARAALADIAAEFQRQHREQLERAIGQYAVRDIAEAHNLVNLLPWVLYYLKRIRAFRDSAFEPDQLIEYLAAALGGKDFLMTPRS